MLVAAVGLAAVTGLVACAPSSSSPLPQGSAGATGAGGPTGSGVPIGSAGASASASGAPTPGASASSASPTAGPTPAATPTGPFTLTSPAFANGGPIPAAYTCDGADVSPMLAWSGAPIGTAGYALIVDDLDAAGFVHWLAYDIPGRSASLARAIGPPPAGPTQGRNGFGRLGWGGPCPPRGTHRYRFRIDALDVALTLPSGVGLSRLTTAIQGHLLGQAQLVGTYRR